MPSQIINASLAANQTQLQSFLKRRRDDERFAKLLEFSATLGLIAIFIIFAIRPAVVTIGSLYSEIKAKEQLKQELKQKINTIVTAQQNFAAIQSKYQILEQVLPQSPELTDAGVQFRGLLQTQNVTQPKTINFNLESVPATLVSSDKNLQSAQLNFKIPITYPQVKPFLDSIPNLQRLTYQDELSLTSQLNKDTQKNDLTLNMSPFIFYLSTPPKSNNGK